MKDKIEVNIDANPSSDTAEQCRSVVEPRGGHEQSCEAQPSFDRRDATTDEIKNLSHVTDKIPATAWIAMAAGASERLAYYCVVSVWQNYIQNPRNNHAVPGALNLGQSTATTISNAFLLFQCLMPTLFALVSDMWLGRYKTLMTGLTCYFCGCAIILITSLPHFLDQSRAVGLGGLAASMFLIGLGVGSIKAAIYPFIGDQYPQQKPQVYRRPDGQLVVVDSQRTLQLMYNCFHWFVNIGSIIAIIGTTMLEKRIDFWASYLLASMALLMTILCLVIPSRRFIRVPPTTSVLPSAFRILVAASKSGWSLENAKPEWQLANQGQQVPWTPDLVEELKIGLRTCRVFVWLAPLFLSFNQMYNNLVSQASTMQLGQVPNDAIPAMAAAACVVLGPPIQWMYSFLAARKIPFPPIARITAGFGFSALGMGLAAVTQHVIYSRGPCFNHPLECPASNGGRLPNSVSVWLQLPTYFFIALAEILGLVSVSEYAYNKSPKGMRTLVQALTQLSAMFGAGVGMAISPVARDPNLVWMYGMLSGLVALSAVGFWWTFADDDQKELTTVHDEKDNVCGTSTKAGD